MSWIYDGMFCKRGVRMKSAYFECFTVELELSGGGGGGVNLLPVR